MNPDTVLLETRPQTKVYIASKLSHAAKLIDFKREDIPGALVTSRWLHMVSFEQTAKPADFTWCWMIDENDVRDCDVLLIYGEPDDELRGALIEVGMAIALRKVVLVVGDCPSFGTWQYHPQVVRLDILQQAANVIREWRP